MHLCLAGVILACHHYGDANVLLFNASTTVLCAMVTRLISNDLTFH